jgi:glycosyltransferase involved in cell wall biosynthesis
LPLALLEYGHGGLAVVATDVGDCRLVISGTVYGALVPSLNDKALADSIKVYIKDSELRSLTGLALRTVVMENFSLKASIKQLLKLYN